MQNVKIRSNQSAEGAATVCDWQIHLRDRRIPDERNARCPLHKFAVQHSLKLDHCVALLNLDKKSRTHMCQSPWEPKTVTAAVSPCAANAARLAVITAPLTNDCCSCIHAIQIRCLYTRADWRSCSSWVQLLNQCNHHDEPEAWHDSLHSCCCC